MVLGISNVMMIILLNWKLHIYKKVKHLAVAIGIDLCLEYCKCLTNDISDDFVKLFCRGI